MALTKVLRGGLSTGISDSSDATAMTISSDEDVMIGTTDESSGAKFIVGSTDDDKRAFIQGSNQYRLGLKNGSNNHVWLGSGGADNFRVSNSSGSTLFELNSSGNIVLPSSNAGIHLGVTSATASNLLDDYEEGTYTPSYSSVGGTNPTVTYTYQFGRYTKVGNKVFWEVRLQHSSSSGGSGTLKVNLPFTSASNFYQVATVGYGSSFTVAVKTGYGDPSTANIYFVGYNVTGGNETTSSLNTSGGLLAMSGQYEV